MTPSPLARRAARLWLGSIVLLGVEFSLTGHAWAALAVGVLVAWLSWMWRRARRLDHERPRRLLLSTDGSMHLLSVAGTVMPVALHPASVCLGPWLLLLVRGHRHTHRLLLGPDNLDSALLAALRRRVRALKTGREEVGILQHSR